MSGCRANTVAFWYPLGICSRTLQIPKSANAQVPYIKWSSTVGPPIPRVPCPWVLHLASAGSGHQLALLLLVRLGSYRQPPAGSLGVFTGRQQRQEGREDTRPPEDWGEDSLTPCADHSKPRVSPGARGRELAPALVGGEPWCSLPQGAVDR